jgi:outer membrane immunogenic protein
MSRVVTIVSVALAALAAASAAFAADVEPVVAPGPFDAPPAFPARRPTGEPVYVPGPFEAPPAFPAVKPYNWTGVYVGINAGAGWGRSSWSSSPDATSGSFDISGGLIGGTLGYNLQTGDPFVLGGEVDIAATSFKGTVSPPTCAPNCAISSPWLATARLRFGYAFNDILPYVTVGVSIGHLIASIAGEPLGIERANNLSWVGGFGVELVLMGPWTAKVEYLHVDLSGLTCNFACNGPVAMNFNENIIRAGINYRIWRN